MTLEAEIKKALGTNVFKPTGASGGGCINKGAAYKTDHGVVFVKTNDRYQSRDMFEGEYMGLLEMEKTKAIRVPTPIVVVQDPNGHDSALVMEYIDMRNCRNQSTLGTHLARMHMHNLGRKGEMDYVSQFGFEVSTCCGFIKQPNDWSRDWVHFFTEQRLGHQFYLLQKEGFASDDVYDLWHELKPKIPLFFENLEIQPSLLHGDLWSGNIAETNNPESEPVVIDPACFYGHHEYDLGISDMFGGFNSSFYTAYHSVIPKEPGFEDRHELYQLFHYLNHWNHFGSGYRASALNIMKKLIKKKK